ncbi:SHOCT domain-containing protein [Alteromonas australica]|uniref:SHOCT domain-containing protein n=1 Tax=Alteromonas australica TaxID=589873 RepID=UPI002353B2AB|nr:SHOCT domain-containing protein [Alteromonas australica]
MFIFKRLALLVFTGVLMSLGGCATLNYPSPMLETETFEKLISIKPVAPKEKIYRQYVRNGFYFQFERMDENNVIYGWYTCTDCNWTRSKMLAVYDGSYLYVTYGHHEEFFLEAPENIRHHPNFSHWSWSAINKYQIEGRNLILLGQIRKCEYMSPMIREWSNSVWTYDGEIDCTYQESGRYKSIFVATIDETLTGSRSSIVGAENDALDGDITNKLSKLKDLYERGLITQEEYEQKRKEILSNL